MHFYHLHPRNEGAVPSFRFSKIRNDPRFISNQPRLGSQNIDPGGIAMKKLISIMLVFLTLLWGTAYAESAKSKLDENVFLS